MADPKYPTVNIPAKKTKSAPSATGAFNSFINAHPTMRPYADTVSKWAKFYGVDQTVMAALFWKESFAQASATGGDPATIESPTKAGVGIGQINPIHVGEKTPWGATVTQSDLTNPEFNIRWSTWYFSNALAKTGNIDTAYSQGYNPGYAGPALTKLLPANYVPSSSLTPTQQASGAGEKKAAAATLNDPWVVVTPKGFKYVNAPEPPKNVLTYGGAPVSRNGQWQGAASFNSVWTQNYADTFEAYTGRKATAPEIAGILKQAPSVYGLANQLAQRGSFAKSPVYKQHAPALLADARTILGNGWTPSGQSKGLISQAIAGNWDQATFEAKIRQLPEYTKGPEYQTNYAQNENAFTSTYGVNADDSVKGLLASVTKAGWTPNQFQSWLMNQDAYKQSPSYQAKSLSFLTQLGLVTGAVPTLTKDQVDQTLTAGDNLHVPGKPQTTLGPPPSPAGSPGTTTANPVDKPSGAGATGFGA